jgi:transcriptional regulator with XRE-family HTH domain
MAASPQPSLGTSLRALRQGRRLSVREVAEATGISPSFLSLVETGRSDITIGRLTRLVEFFGVSLVDLLEAQPTADAHIVRHREQRRLHSEAEGIDIFLLVPDTRRAMMPMLLSFRPGAGLAEYGRHAGEEWVHVLEGQLSLELEGEPPRTLAAGDSAYYSATHPHGFSNPDPSAPLRVLCVDTPPNL